MDTETASLMEPMTVNSPLLEDLAVDLVQKSSALSAMLHPVVAQSIARLVRSMNCYYSNFIEGHDTYPFDIDSALREEFSSEVKQRALQKEALAHIVVQCMIDEGEDSSTDPLSIDYALWIHKEFCKRLSEEMLWVENPDTGERIRVIPGELRDRSVIVGQHIPPKPENLEPFIQRYKDVYITPQQEKVKRILAIAAAHHRFLWIHPFVDGNGRVVRLMSYAALLKLNISNSTWSIARGLARSETEYKSLLQYADIQRQGDYDGRGNLSAKALAAFCEFFLHTCIDQIEYMSSLLNTDDLLNRIEFYVKEEEHAGRLRKESFKILKETLLVGEVTRGKVAEVTGLSERTARRMIAELVEKELLVSATPKSAVKLGFPLAVVGRWLPELYPSRHVS